jgi:hypothetical protein
MTVSHVHCTKLHQDLPIGRLPCKEERRRKHRIRVDFGEVRNAFMQTLQGDARVMKREISRFTRLTNPRQMRRRKRENRVHHGRMRCGDTQKSVVVSTDRSLAQRTEYDSIIIRNAYFGIMSVQRVSLDVRCENISLEMVATWCTKRKSVFGKMRHCGCG